MSGFLMHMFLPMVLSAVAGTIAVWIHANLDKGESWYAKTNPTLKAAIGVIVAMGLTWVSTLIPSLQPAAAACNGTSSYLTTDCVNALGALFTKDNILYVLTALITIGGHINAATHEQLKYTKAMALKARITRV